MSRAYILLLPVFVSVLACTSQPCGTPPACCEPVKVMPLGDSITAGYSDRTEPVQYEGYRKPLYCRLVSSGRSVDFMGSLSNGQGFDSDHEGHSGRTASWLNSRMEEFLQSDPDIILYHIGTNDLWREDYTTYAGHVNETLEIIYTYDPETKVVLAKIILTLGDMERNSRTHLYNLLLDEIAGYWSGMGYNITLVDMESALSWLDMEDDLHPSAYGHSKMADVWYDALVELIPTCDCQDS